MPKKARKEKKPKTGLRQLYQGCKQRLKESYIALESKTKKSIRLEILWIVGISFIISSITFFCVAKVLHATTGEYSYTSYEESRNEVENNFLDTVKRLNALQGNLGEYISLAELYTISQEDETLAITDLQQYLTTITNGKLVFNQAVTEAKKEEVSDAVPEDKVSEDAVISNTQVASEANEEVATVTQLYKQLARLQQLGEWDDQRAEAILTQYLKQNNVDTQEIALLAAQAEVENLRERISSYSEKADVYLVDSTGQLIYSDGYIEKLDLVKIIQSVNNSADENNSAYKSIYPVIINGQVYYIFTEATLEQQIYYGHNEGVGNIIGFITAVGIFILLLTRLTKDKIAYIEYLSSCLGEISKGDLSYKIDIIGEDELAQVARNITIMEHEIKAQIKAQMSAEKAKNELVTNVAHDLRTPLTSIAGGANFLVNNLDTVESDTSLNIIQDISKEAMRLNGMVENLLNMTRIQEGNFKINKKLEVVDDIISTAVSAITNRKENHELVVKETKDIILFPCDAQLIVQVLVNLLDNAFKHTPDASKVMLKAFVRNNNIIFQVIDNGKGIEIKQLNHIFDDFFTTSLDNGDHKRGIGLGLAICKAIVEAHKGEIKAFNNDLGGATFELSLPLEEENNE